MGGSWRLKRPRDPFYRMSIRPAVVPLPSASDDGIGRPVLADTLTTFNKAGIA